MGIPVELWRARIGSFRCRGSVPKGHCVGVSGVTARLTAAYTSKHNLVACTRCYGDIFLLSVNVNGTFVSLIVSRDLFLNVITAMRVFVKGMPPGAFSLQLLALLTNWKQRPDHHGRGAMVIQYSSKCTMTAKRLLAVATLVYMMLILAGDIETNPGPTLYDKPTWEELILLRKEGQAEPLVRVINGIMICIYERCVVLAQHLLSDHVAIEKLKKNNPQIEEFVLTVLAEWLQRSDDDSVAVLHCSWESLAVCIERAGLPGSLPKAIRNCCTENSTVFQTLQEVDRAANSTLSELMTDICGCNFQPGEVALLIKGDDGRVLQQCKRVDLTDQERKKVVIKAMIQHGQEGVFQSFIVILESEPSNDVVVKRIKEFYKESGGELACSIFYHSSKLEQLMKRNNGITVGVMHCMPFGPPRIGKTCIKNRLAGKESRGKPATREGDNILYPKDVSMSTGAAEEFGKLVVRVGHSSSTTFQKQDEKWVQYDYDQEVISLVKGLENLVNVSSNAFQETAPSSQENEPVGPKEQELLTESDQQALSTSYAAEEETDEPITNKHPKQQPVAMPVQLQDVGFTAKEKVKEDINPQQLLRATFDHEHPSKVKELLRDSLTIHFTDTGGQPEFQELIPMLVAGPSLFFLVFSLATSLDHTYTVRYNSGENEPEPEPYESSFTVETALIQCLASIACIDVKRKVDREVKDYKPKVFFIGTQLDLLTNNTQKQLDEINSKLWKAIEGIDQQDFGLGLGLQELVEPFDDKKHFIFAVNNYAQSDASFTAIRSAISKLAEREKVVYKVELPVQFVLLDFYLRQPKERRLQEEDCKKVLKKHGSDTAALKRCLKKLTEREEVDICDPSLLAKAARVLNDSDEQIPPKIELTDEQIPPTELTDEQIPPKTELTDEQIPPKTELTDEQIPPKTELTDEQILTKTKSALQELNDLSHYRDHVMTMEQFEAIAKKCGVNSKDDLELALWTLHHLLGTIRHYPDVDKLKDTVITHQQFFFNIFTKLITSTFVLKNKREKTDHTSCDKFKNQGFFTMHDLEKVWEQEQKARLTSQQLVALLQHLHILAHFTRKLKDDTTITEYFLPCVLKHAPQSDTTDKSIGVPLFVSFVCGFKPNGMFSGLLAFLMEHKDDSLNVELRKELLFRDQASLYVDDSFIYLTIKAMPKYIRFSLHSQEEEESTNDICATVKAVIEKGLKEVASTLNYNIKAEPIFGFECACGKKPTHFAMYGRKYSKCSLDAHRFRAPCGYSQWLPKVTESIDGTGGSSSSAHSDTLSQKKTTNVQSVEPSTAKSLVDCAIMLSDTQTISEDTARLSRKRVMQIMSPTVPGAKIMKSDSIDSEDKLQRKLTIRDLLDRVSAKASDKWRLIGIQLGIESHRLTTISTDTTDIFGRHQQVFDLWLNKGSPPFTWATIINVLKAPSIEEVKLARELEEWVTSQP